MNVVSSPGSAQEGKKPAETAVLLWWGVTRDSCQTDPPCVFVAELYTHLQGEEWEGLPPYKREVSFIISD